TLEDARRPALETPSRGRELDEAPLGGEVASQRIERTRRLVGLLEREGHHAVGRRAVPRCALERRSFDRGRGTVEVAAANAPPDHRRRSAHAMEILAHKAPR